VIKKADLFENSIGGVLKVGFYYELKRVLDELVDKVNDLDRRVGSDELS